jgi:hypothetical protein
MPMHPTLIHPTLIHPTLIHPTPIDSTGPIVVQARRPTRLRRQRGRKRARSASGDFFGNRGRCPMCPVCI